MRKDITLLSMTKLDDTEKEMILEWRNHKEIRKWMHNSRIIDKDTHFNFIERLKNDEKNKYFLVKNKDDHLGVIYFTHIDPSSNESHFGLYAKPGLKGTGDMLMYIVTEYAFKTLKVNKLIAEVFEDNSKAIDLYKRSGFKICGEKIADTNNILCMELENEYR